MLEKIITLKINGFAVNVKAKYEYADYDEETGYGGYVDEIDCEIIDKDVLHDAIIDMAKDKINTYEESKKRRSCCSRIF